MPPFHLIHRTLTLSLLSLVSFYLLNLSGFFLILFGFILSVLSFFLFFLLLIPLFLQSQLYFALIRHGLGPLLSSHHHLLVGEKTLVQGLLDHLVLQALADEDELLSPVAVRPLLAV